MGQAKLNSRIRAARPAALEPVDCPLWAKTKSILVGGELCLEEMAPALMARAPVRAGDWDVVGAEVEWAEIVPVQAPLATVSAPTAGQQSPMRLASLAMV